MATHANGFTRKSVQPEFPRMSDRNPRRRNNEKDACPSDESKGPAATAPRISAPARTTKTHISFSKNEFEVREYDPACGRNIGPERRVADTGCGDDLIGCADLTPQDWQDVEQLEPKLCLYTANGTVCSDLAIAFR